MKNNSFKDFKVSCTNCSLDKLCLPRGLSKSEVEHLSVIVKDNGVLEQGQYLYRQGDAFTGILAIKSGAAKLVTSDREGNEHILNVLLPGELLGFDGVQHNQYECSAIALETMSFCQVPGDELESLCQQVPGMMREFFKHTGEVISDNIKHTVSIKRPAEEKLAFFLSNLGERLKQRGFSSDDFNLPLTRQEVGDYLGLTLETVSRTLKQFKDDGLITVQKKHITIINQQGLEQLFK